MTVLGENIDKRASAFLRATIGAIAIAVASCQLLVGIEDRREGVNRATDARADASPPMDPCAVVGAPARPSIADDGTQGEFVFALSRIDFGLDGGLPFALNLDRTCTCPGVDSCARPAGENPACDGDRGEDNATSAALAVLARSGTFSETTLNQNLREGISGALLRIQRYNGLPDDPSVTASFYGAIAFDGPRPTGRPEDQWIVDQSSLVTVGNEYQPRYADPNAFVSGGTLVAAFDFPVDVGGNAVQAPLRLDLHSGVIVARLDPSIAIVEGVLGGRWPASSILTTVETLPDPLKPGARICPGSTTFDVVRNLVCASRDVTRDPLLDKKGAACDALSTVIGFEGRAARFGRIESRRSVPRACDGGAPPATTTCE